jgi:hypothetical protein
LAVINGKTQVNVPASVRTRRWREAQSIRLNLAAATRSSGLYQNMDHDAIAARVG